MNNISRYSCYFEKVKKFKALEIVGVKIDDKWYLFNAYKYIIHIIQESKIINM